MMRKRILGLLRASKTFYPHKPSQIRYFSFRSSVLHTFAGRSILRDRQRRLGGQQTPQDLISALDQKIDAIESQMKAMTPSEEFVVQEKDDDGNVVAEYREKTEIESLQSYLKEVEDEYEELAEAAEYVEEQPEYQEFSKEVAKLEHRLMVEFESEPITAKSVADLHARFKEKRDKLFEHYQMKLFRRQLSEEGLSEEEIEKEVKAVSFVSPFHEQLKERLS